MKAVTLSVSLALLASMLHAAAAPGQVVSHVEGHITVNPEIDPTTDYSGFDVIVGTFGQDGLDTLGHGSTDRSGYFTMRVEVPDRGIYPLYITRRGELVGTGDIAVAQGDSAVMSAELPLAGRLVRIRSAENAAWTAFRNTSAQYNDTLLELVQDGEGDITDRVANAIVSTASIFYSVHRNYPNTFGGELALAESITMLAGWDDELLLERAQGYTPDQPRFLDVARAKRRAVARLHGLEASVGVLDELSQLTTSEDYLAALQAERVQAYIDNLDQEGALQAASDLIERYPNTTWAEWARRTEYEITTLFPGNPALDFTAHRLDGTPVNLSDMQGDYIIVEFWEPRNAAFQQQLPQREMMIDRFGDQPVRIVSVSLDADRGNIEAFKEGRAFGGDIVYDPDGVEGESVRLYNVTHLPTRILINPDFTIAGKYVGDAVSTLTEDLALMLETGPVSN